MKPLDPRLLRRASAARSFLAVGAVVGIVQTIAIVTFAWCTAQLISRAVEGATLAELAPFLGGLAAAVLVRGLTIWGTDAAAASASARVKVQLRSAALDAIARHGPDAVHERGAGPLTTVLAGGLDALDGYFGKYVPQLILTAVATPMIILVMLWEDPLSGIIVIVALPLIPLFMVLIGRATQTVQAKQWRTLQYLSASFLDLVGGLATLKIFGREDRQRERMARIGEEYRVETMKVLRVSFLSGFVLEIGASLSVALVAVEIGLRLLDGQLPLAVGLFVLLLAPEAFLPVRAVGTQFHAAADGIAAADDVLDLIEDPDVDRPAPMSGTASQTTGPGRDLVLADVSVVRSTRPVVSELSARLAPGTFVVVVGPSGAGKSSLLRAVAGLSEHGGSILLGGRPVERADVAWAGQRAGLMVGSVAANVALGDDRPESDAVRAALDDVALDGLDADTVLDATASGLSGGQSQRVAIARALYRARGKDCGLLLLDEPSSALDPETERRLLSTLRSEAASGRIVMVVTHRPALIEAADAVITLEVAAYV
ncbi:thiol reductant ABC exporter subunit CydD [Glaciibacter flavus]|uniref:thiol reductant ABC exporter subunit CydD n=1 Tax=Orlajensenia flava TaxID=2565934 RepID=UPI003B00CFE8